MTNKKSNKLRFSWPQVVAILVVLALSVAIILFRDEIIKLGSLGYIGVFFMMLLSSVTIILPAPSLSLLFAFGATLPNPLLVGIVAGVGSAIGELSGYVLGRSSSGLIESSNIYKKIERAVEKREFLTIFALAFVPNPLFDVAGIAAGALKVPWQRFLLATLLGKTARNILIALAGWYSVDWILGM